MNKNILLKGYYAHGNFGDDLLLKTSIKLLSNFNCNIYVDKKVFEYLNHSYSNVFIYNSNINISYVVYGGGGMFFDFSKKTNIKSILLNTFATYKPFRAIFQKLKKSSNKVILLGNGIGPYNAFSPRRFQNIMLIHNSVLNIVRDSESFNFLNDNNFKNNFQTTDLVFNTNHWMENCNYKSNSLKNAELKNIGVVFRSWKFEQIDYNQIMVNLQQQFPNSNFKIILLQPSDQVVLQNIKAKFQSVIYKGESLNDIDVFTDELAKLDLIVTMRAHAAIVGSCINTPSLILPIEPKLVNIHKMIPNSSFLNSNLYDFNSADITKWFSQLKSSNFETDLNNNKQIWNNILPVLKNKFHE